MPTRDVAEEVEPTGTKSTSPIIVMEGTGYRVRRGEILALNLSERARLEALASGLQIVRKTELGPEQTLTVLKGDSFDAPTQMIERLQAVDPDGIFTPNHIYSASAGSVDAIDGERTDIKKADSMFEGHRVGMIDGLPDQTHPDIAGILVETISFAETPIGISTHGTAIALRLRDVGANHMPYEGLQLYAADILSDEDGQSATAETLAEALAWQSHNRIDVLNISLAGPPNQIVAVFIQQFLATGGQITAAVGNGGPLSMDIYPAAYTGVVGVTAHDEFGQVFSLATRGGHVDLAAPGVDISIGGLSKDGTWSGTSYAAPYAAIWLLAVNHYGLTLAETCIDAGAPGRDDVYGCGLIRLDQLPRPQLASKRKYWASKHPLKEQGWMQYPAAP